MERLFNLLRSMGFARVCAEIQIIEEGKYLQASEYG